LDLRFRNLGVGLTAIVEDNIDMHRCNSERLADLYVYVEGFLSIKQSHLLANAIWAQLPPGIVQSSHPALSVIQLSSPVIS